MDARSYDISAWDKIIPGKQWIFDTYISPPTQDGVILNEVINDSQDLSGIRIGSHDEICQANRPVLVGIDHRSTHCYLLAVEDSCDETTWGVHLLVLSDHGLDLERTIADGGTESLRAC